MVFANKAFIYPYPIAFRLKNIQIGVHVKFVYFGDNPLLANFIPPPPALILPFVTAIGFQSESNFYPRKASA